LSCSIYTVQSNVLLLLGIPKLRFLSSKQLKFTHMKKLTLLILLFISISIFAQEKTQIIPITEDLSTYLNQRSDNDLVRINIRLKDQYNMQSLKAQLASLDRSQKRELVKNELKAFSMAAQADLLNFLEDKSYMNEAEVIHRFWIVNVVTCMASEAVIYDLAMRSDIERIDIDEERNLLANEPVSTPNPILGIDEITYNVLKVNAPDVWALGFTGQGIVVSVIDSGVNYNHVDLADHMWEDDDYPNHGWDFYNNDNDPMDGHGHGTHCAGTVAGDGTAGSQTGMAPDASIMACKVLADGGDGAESGVWAAIEFTVDNGGDIISMSLGWQHSWNPDRESWRTTMDNALAAGVIASVAAGNEGGSITNPDDVRTPGDCPPPWLHPEQTLQGGISAVVCIGATNSSDGIASFSSRGPSSWENVSPYFDYPFNPEMGLLRPDVSAPGVDVKSCDAFNTNGYSYKSGTSMATPGVAGVMALILSKNPNLSPEDMTSILETTAVDLGATGKDNVFGSGRVDALEAVTTANAPGPVYYSHTISDDNENGEIESGESVALTLELFNGSDDSYTDVNVTVSTESAYIDFSDSTEAYGDFTSEEYKTIADGFAFDVMDGTPGNESVKFMIEATDGNEVWNSSFNILTYGPNPNFGSLIVDDESEGNNNGRLDPGETADLIMMVHNSGQADITDVLVNLQIANELVTIENPEFTIESIISGNAEPAVFTIMVSEEATIGSSVGCLFDLSSGFFADTKNMSLGIGLIVEDWESDTFGTFDWEFDGSSDWTISDETPYEGLYCSQSGQITHSQSTSLILTYEVGVDDSISFYKEVSSEANYDYLSFYIDNVKMGEWAGEVAWSRSAYPVSYGVHTFKWEYDKDVAVTNGDDRARIDFITLPPTILPVADAGEDALICSTDTFAPAAMAEDYTSLEWTTTGDGTFDDATVIDPVYTPGTYDIENAEVSLKLTAYGNNGDVSNSMNLEIVSSPDAPAMPEGETSFCIDPGVALYTTDLIDEVGYIWMIDPATAGTTESDSSSALVSWSADFTGMATIQVKAMNWCGESAFSDMLSVEIFNNPEVNLGEDTETCIGNYVSLDAGNEGAAYLWSTGETTQTINVDTTGMDETNTRTITVMVTDINGCSSEDEIMVSFLDCSGISENNVLTAMEIFPNPNNGMFTIQLNAIESQEAQIELINLRGEVVFKDQLQLIKGSNTKKIQANHLSDQLYYLRIVSEKGIATKKVVIKK
jgi:subtilisin family serine protease